MADASEAAGLATAIAVVTKNEAATVVTINEDVDSEERVCWICLGDEANEKLSRPCPCPRWVHSSCLTRWQVTNIGKEAEKKCGFCKGDLPVPPLTPRVAMARVRARYCEGRAKYIWFGIFVIILGISCAVLIGLVVPILTLAS
mmetsp:Transcript_14041/g.23242  ORF Transcript_14041/g.23242 Transcript_14041/m.23242 type:complete len:144 (+) Transcript_14041:140-571(+)